jgi:predicted ArsR family transcriptional regulator
VDNTRTKIMDLLRRRREATIDDLTTALDLAPATIRRHLDILQRDGYVTVRPVRRETGRPHYAFSMTEAGEDLFPRHYVRITSRLIEEILALGPEDTAGRSGHDLAAVIFDRMAQRLVKAYGPRISGALDERLRQVARLLAGEGLSLEVEQHDGEWFIVGSGCPCQRVTRGESEGCSHDERLLQALLRADVSRVPNDGGAGGFWGYRVRESAGSAL